jgi:hypothetical protein
MSSHLNPGGQDLPISPEDYELLRRLLRVVRVLQPETRDGDPGTLFMLAGSL